MKAKMLGLVAAGLLVVPLAANAVTTYTDRATWQAAAGGGTGDIAEDFSAAPENWLPYDADGFAISETGDGGAIVTYHGALVTNLDSNSGDDTITFTFDRAIRAFGFSLVAEADYSGATISFATDIGESGSYITPSSVEFRGFLFSGPITTFTIDHTAGGYLNRWAYHTLDDLEAFSAPEPGTLALLGLGLAGLGLLRRRTSH